MIFKQSQSCLDRLNLKGSAIGNIIDSYVDMKHLSKSINPPHAVIASLLPVSLIDLPLSAHDLQIPAVF